MEVEKKAFSFKIMCQIPYYNLIPYLNILIRQSKSAIIVYKDSEIISRVSSAIFDTGLGSIAILTEIFEERTAIIQKS